jgi:CRISPR system Cascade subunit CasC
MLIQIHILQNYAPSNLNRDDTGSPKDAMFGGYRRGRISSQCLKRNIRLSDAFKDAFEKDDLIATRTKLLSEQVKSELGKLKVADETAQAILVRIPEIGRKGSKGEEAEGEPDEEASSETGEVKTKQLIFLAPGEAKLIAEKLVALYKEKGKKEFTKVKIADLEAAIQHETPRSVDISMFGRMTTSKAFDNIHASVQVAHALSTNTITQEFDYYTAMDDLKPDSEPGADMIGDVEFNSSTYYKYINIHWEKLLENLGNDTEVARRAVLALVEAAVFSQPTGKQNSFAAQNLPDMILLEVSPKNVPVSYANAFLKPVFPKSDKNLMDASVNALSAYLGKVSGTFNLKAERAFTSTQEYEISGAETKDSLADLQDWLSEKIGK